MLQLINCFRVAARSACYLVLAGYVGIAVAEVTILTTPDGGLQPRLVTDRSDTVHLLYFKKARIRPMQAKAIYSIAAGINCGKSSVNQCRYRQYHLTCKLLFLVRLWLLVAMVGCTLYGICLKKVSISTPDQIRRELNSSHNALW